MALPAGTVPARNTPPWQFWVLPVRPHHCVATPTLSVPALTKPDSSMTPTVPSDHCLPLAKLLGEDGLDLAKNVARFPGRG